MKKKLGLIACVILAALPAAAQRRGSDAPTFEVGGGYTFRQFTLTQNVPAEGGSSAQTNSVKLNMNGWNATVGYNFNEVLGVVTDFDMTRNTQPTTSLFAGTITVSTLMVGPQIYPIGHHRITPFAHVEVGLADLNPTSPASTGCGSFDNGPCTITNASFAFAAGGGVDFTLTKMIAARLAEFDFEQTRFYTPGVATGFENQNHYKVKAGIIIRFGEK